MDESKAVQPREPSNGNPTRINRMHQDNLALDPNSSQLDLELLAYSSSLLFPNDRQLPEALQEEKRSLRTQISELEDLLSEVEFSISLTPFSDIANTNRPKPPGHQKQSCRITNMDYILQHELYKLSGLYCVKITKHEYIFNFTPFPTSKQESIYSVQFFTNNNKGTLGKYVMPTSGIMDSIVEETPIDKLTNLLPFFRNCKRHLECFADRKEQFSELKELTSSVENIEIDADVGFGQVTCSFHQVYHKKLDKFMNLTLFLTYNYGKTRPSTMDVDWSIKRQPNDGDVRGMKSFVKSFRGSRLADAYRHLLENVNADYSWEATENNDDRMRELEVLEESDEEAGRPRRVETKTAKGSGTKSKEADAEDEEREGSDEDSRSAKKVVVKTKKRPDAKYKEATAQDEEREGSDGDSRSAKKVVKMRKRPDAKSKEAAAEEEINGEGKEEEDLAGFEGETRRTRTKANKRKRVAESKRTPAEIDDEYPQEVPLEAVKKRKVAKPKEGEKETFKQPKSRQGTLDFLRLPKDREATLRGQHSDDRNAAVTSTPMPAAKDSKVRPLRGSLDISPIVAVKKGRKKKVGGKTDVKKK